MKLTKHRKCQIIFACIPFLGFFLVFFNIVFFLKKHYGCGYLRQALFCLFGIPVILLGLLSFYIIYRYAIFPFSPSMAILVTISLIVFAVIYIGVGFALIGMEKLYLYIIFKDIPQQQNETELP